MVYYDIDDHALWSWLPRSPLHMLYFDVEGSPLSYVGVYLALGTHVEELLDDMALLPHMLRHHGDILFVIWSSSPTQVIYIHILWWVDFFFIICAASIFFMMIILLYGDDMTLTTHMLMHLGGPLLRFLSLFDPLDPHMASCMLTMVDCFLVLTHMWELCLDLWHRFAPRDWCFLVH